MIRHILLIQFKSDASAEHIETLKQSFESMPSKIIGVHSVEWGLNNSPEGKNKDYTHAVIMTFADNSGRDIYLTHPEHDALKSIFEPILKDIVVLDYELNY